MPRRWPGYRPPFAAPVPGAWNAARGLFLLALLANAALQLFALLVLAGGADLGAPGGGFLHLRLAFRRVLRLGAHLAAHAVTPFVALLPFAGLALFSAAALWSAT